MPSRELLLQLVERKRLLEKADRPQPLEPLERRLLRVSGHDDGREVDVAAMQLLEQIEAAHAGHADVHEQAAAAIAVVALEEVLRRREHLARDADRAQQFAERRAHGFFVVDHEHGRGRGHAVSDANGSSKKNTAPPRSDGSVPIRPPCASTSDWQIDSPSPRPLDFVLWNGWNSRSAIAGSIPGPESATATRTLAPSRRVAMVSRRSAEEGWFIASIALRIRFTSPC